MREKQENERRGKGLKQYIADRRLAAVSLVLGVLMGLMILLGIRYSRNELIYRTAGQFLGQLAGWVVCMTVMVWAICVGLDALGRGWPEIRDFQFGKFLSVYSNSLISLRWCILKKACILWDVMIYFKKIFML